MEKRIDVKDIDLASFKALEDNKEAFYRISGTVTESTEPNTKFDLQTYGNFALTDGTTEVYVYGVVPGYGGPSKQFATLGVEKGDKLTIVCYKTSYTKNGYVLNQAGGAFYVSHEKGSSEGGETPGETVETITLSDYFTENTNLEDGKTYNWGSLSCTFTKKNNSTSNFNAGDPGLRFYASDILAISSDKTIKKLAFEFYGNKKGPFTADSGEVETTETHVVWTGSSNTVTLTADNQIRFKSITVTY